MTRAEHLQWAKNRALEYIDEGRPDLAFTSFASDVTKHPDTLDLIDVIQALGAPLLLTGHLRSPANMRKWINDFN